MIWSATDAFGSCFLVWSSTTAFALTGCSNIYSSRETSLTFSDSIVPISIIARTRSTLFSIPIRKLQRTILTLSCDDVEYLSNSATQTFVLLKVKVVRKETPNTSCYIDPLWEKSCCYIALTTVTCFVEKWAVPARMASSFGDVVVEWTLMASTIVHVRSWRWTSAVVDSWVVNQTCWAVDRQTKVNGHIVWVSWGTYKTLLCCWIEHIRKVASCANSFMQPRSGSSTLAKSCGGIEDRSIITVAGEWSGIPESRRDASRAVDSKMRVVVKRGGD